jgi:hypothetical protein
MERRLQSSVPNLTTTKTTEFQTGLAGIARCLVTKATNRRTKILPMTATSFEGDQGGFAGVQVNAMVRPRLIPVPTVATRKSSRQEFVPQACHNEDFPSSTRH